MRKVLISITLIIFLTQPLMAQLFAPTNYPPVPPSIPNFGTRDDSVYGNFNQASIVNALLVYYLQNYSNINVDLDSTYTHNSIIDNSSRLNEYGPLQNGFYLNRLRFESEIKPGLTVFGMVRNQDDFNRFGDFKFRTGSFMYNLQYTKLINRQIASTFQPNGYGADVNVYSGFPNRADVPGYIQVLESPLLADLPGFNARAFFFPRIDDVLVNDFHYTFDSGLGIRASNWLVSQTGLQQYSANSFPILNIQTTLGRNNNFSDTNVGVDYTSKSDWQFFYRTGFQDWSNKQEIRQDLQNFRTTITTPQLFALAYLGAQPAFIPCHVGDVTTNCTPVPGNNVILDWIPVSNDPLIYKDEDTRWSVNHTALRIPVSKSASLTGSWKKWDKISAGTFGIPVTRIFGLEQNTDLANPINPATFLQPGFIVSQYRGELNWNINRNSGAFINFGYWEEIPNLGVRARTQRSRNNVFANYAHRIGKHSFSIFGGWEQETVSRNVEPRDIRTWWPFNPIVNTQFQLGALGTATFRQSDTPGTFSTVSFTPNPGVGIAPFTQSPNFPAPCVPGVLQSECGTNTIVYPVGGIVNVPPGAIFYAPGPYPVVAPVGRQSFKTNSYTVKFRASGQVMHNLDYRLTVQRNFADNAIFRTDDSMDAWKGKASLDWSPSDQFTVAADFDLHDQKSNRKYLYPFSYRENNLTVYANYLPSESFSFYAGYRNYTQKIDFASPIMNSSTANFMGPETTVPAAVVFGPAGVGGYDLHLPTTGSGYDLFAFTTFAQYLANPLNSIVDNMRNQDQEVSIGTTWIPGKDWSLQFGYERSRPQTFQGLSLSNLVSATTCFSSVTGLVVSCATPGSIPVTFNVNEPVGFLSGLPQLQAMQAVDGRRNVYSFRITRRLRDSSELGLVAQLGTFRNLAPRIIAGSAACGPAGAPNFCGSSALLGQNFYQFGTRIDTGQVLSTSLYYSKRF